MKMGFHKGQSPFGGELGDTTNPPIPPRVGDRELKELFSKESKPENQYDRYKIKPL